MPDALTKFPARQRDDAVLPCRSCGTDESSGISMDYYEILGIHESATPSEIRSAYLRHVQEAHPDRHVGEPHFAECHDRFKSIHEAYEVLYDAERRDAYNRHRLLPPSTTRPKAVVTPVHQGRHDLPNDWLIRTRRRSHQWTLLVLSLAGCSTLAGCIAILSFADWMGSATLSFPAPVGFRDQGAENWPPVVTERQGQQPFALQPAPPDSPANETLDDRQQRPPRSQSLRRATAVEEIAEPEDWHVVQPLAGDVMESSVPGLPPFLRDQHTPSPLESQLSPALPRSQTPRLDAHVVPTKFELEHWLGWEGNTRAPAVAPALDSFSGVDTAPLGRIPLGGEPALGTGAATTGEIGSLLTDTVEPTATPLRSPSKKSQRRQRPQGLRQPWRLHDDPAVDIQERNRRRYVPPSTDRPTAPLVYNSLFFPQDQDRPAGGLPEVTLPEDAANPLTLFSTPPASNPPLPPALGSHPLRSSTVPPIESRSSWSVPPLQPSRTGW